LRGVLSWEVSEAMRKGRISKSEMAKRMGTSRSQLERLLDPRNPHVLLETVQKAATAVGKRLTIGLTNAPDARPDAEWWAVLGSNQWPLPCETGVGCLRINDMRAVPPIATRTCCHLISLDITQCHGRTVPKLSQRSLPEVAADLPPKRSF
jgi:hypothetical protein